MSSKRAFSLVEVLIGTCVLLFILFPAFTMMSQSTRLIANSRAHTQASALLQTLVEDFRATTFTDIKAQYFTGRSQPYDLTPLLAKEGFSTTKYFASVELAEQNSRTDFLYATFTISWLDAFGHTQNRQYHTRFSQNGLSDQILRGF